MKQKQEEVVDKIMIQLQKDFNDLKNKLDGEPETPPRPTSGNSKFTEVIGK